MKHLLATAGLDAATATALLDTADTLKRTLLGREVRKLPTLRGRTVVTMFYEDSTRTRVSFEVAGKWMSADVVNVSASGSSVRKGESLRDTALTLSAVGADCVIVRHPASGYADGPERVRKELGVQRRWKALADREPEDQAKRYERQQGQHVHDREPARACVPTTGVPVHAARLTSREVDRTNQSAATLTIRVTRISTSPSSISAAG